MTGEGSAQRRRYNAGGTLGVILPLYAGGTSLSGMSLLSPQHLPLSLKPQEEEGTHGREGTDNTILPEILFWMFSFKQQQNNTGNLQCHDIVKADSPAGNKNGLNIYRGSENKHRFSLAKLKNRVIFVLMPEGCKCSHLERGITQFLCVQGSDFSCSIKRPWPLHGK